MGMMGAPAIATPPPAPAPAPPPAATPASYKTGAKGKVIPVGKHGNRLDTAAGRAKEAKMLQEEQIRVANAAMKVAASERVHGREESANQAAQLANQAAQKAVSINKSHVADVNRRTGSNLKASENLQKFAENIGPSKIPGKPIKPETRTPDDGGGGGGEEDKTETRQPTISRPTAPITAPSPPKPKIVKNPNRDVLDLSRDEFSVSSVSRLLFEQVGSIELVNIARRDTIEGQNPYYSMISNLSTVRKNFDPTSIITRQKSNQGIYSNYTIRLNDKIPDDEYLERNNLTDFYYIDDNGDLVIELDNLASDEIIDFEIAESGTINLVDEA